MAMSTTLNSTKNKTGLNRDGVKGIVREVLRSFVQLAILVIAAGQIGWINAWVYAGLYLSFTITNVAVLIKIDPQLLNERGTGFHKNTKPFDKVILVAIFWHLYLTLAIAGLDAVRYEWSDMSLGLTILGVVMTISAFALAFWAMAVNTHFEGTVRIQSDRNHRVCTSGPYQIVRHPGYVGMILGALGTPLILGSWWGFVPGGIMVFLVVIRTALEDHTLHEELSGYKEFVKITRYRLLPFVW